MKLENQIVGNIGLYFLCYKLSRLGWNVMPTSRNAKGVDIVIYNSDATKYLGIQVKSLSKRNAVPLGNSLEKVMGDFWVIVDKVISDPRAFIITPEEVKNLSKFNEKDGRIAYWLNPPEYDQEKFLEAWHIIK